MTNSSRLSGVECQQETFVTPFCTVGGRIRRATSTSDAADSSQTLVTPVSCSFSSSAKLSADERWQQIRQRVLTQMGETISSQQKEESKEMACHYDQLEQMLSCEESFVLPPCMDKENTREDQQDMLEDVYNSTHILATLKQAAVPEGRLFSPRKSALFANVQNKNYEVSSVEDEVASKSSSSKRRKTTSAGKTDVQPSSSLFHESTECEAGSSGKDEKGLSGLCKRFIQTYSKAPDTFISVDDASRLLQVERRRVYDVVNILECLCVITRECKNTYKWMGMDHLPTLFGRWQAEAIRLWPNDARRNGLEVDTPNSVPEYALATRSARILMIFLQRFLVGEANCCLAEECDKIFALLPTVPDVHASDAKTKTKSNQRRLYDVANVMLSLNIIQKSGSRGKNTTFQWSYYLSPLDIQRSWKNGLRDQANTVSDANRSPISERVAVLAS